MTRTSKKSILTIVILLVVAVGAVGYAYEKQYSKHPAIVVKQQPVKWINIDPAKSGFPPDMITGAPVSAKGTVVYDRYYVDSTGDLHGEYTFDLPLTAEHNQSDLYTSYLGVIQNDKKVIVKSQTPSMILISQAGYSDATIGFTSPTQQMVRVDINYIYSLPTKR